MTYLLDVSALLALLWEEHIHHGRVRNWEAPEQLAVCPITELGFLRISTHSFGAGMDDARESLAAWLDKRRPEFIPCDERALARLKAPSGGKTTDYYLCHLAHAHGMKLATLDESIGHSAAFVIPLAGQ
jgi:predicted nucleic acid-binding protein